MFMKTFHDSILIKMYKFAPIGWINDFDQRRGLVRLSNTLRVLCVVFMRICVDENIDWYKFIKRYGGRPFVGLPIIPIIINNPVKFDENQCYYWIQLLTLNFLGQLLYEPFGLFKETLCISIIMLPLKV